MRFFMMFCCLTMFAGDSCGSDFTKEIIKMNSIIQSSHSIEGVFQPSIDARPEMLRYFNSDESSRLRKILKRYGIVNFSAILDVADVASQRIQKGEDVKFQDLVKFGLKRQKMYQHPVIHNSPPPPPS